MEPNPSILMSAQLFEPEIIPVTLETKRVTVALLMPSRFQTFGAIV